MAFYTAVVLVRERDRARGLLLTAVVVTLLLTALRLTPAFDDLHQWWLD